MALIDSLMEIVTMMNLLEIYRVPITHIGFFCYSNSILDLIKVPIQQYIGTIIITIFHRKNKFGKDEKHYNISKYCKKLDSQYPQLQEQFGYVMIKNYNISTYCINELFQYQHFIGTRIKKNYNIQFYW